MTSIKKTMSEGVPGSNSPGRGGGVEGAPVAPQDLGWAANEVRGEIFKGAAEFLAKAKGPEDKERIESTARDIFAFLDFLEKVPQEQRAAILEEGLRQRKISQDIYDKLSAAISRPVSSLDEWASAGENAPQKRPSTISEALKLAKITGEKELVLHGDYYYKEGEAKEDIISPKADLDARVAVYIMRLSGIKWQRTTYVKKGAIIPGRIHLDTGPYGKPTLTPDGSIFLSGHEEVKPEKPTSASQMAYEELVKAGLLKQEEWLDNLTSFVTEIDNLSYPIDEEFLRKEWWKTLYGLERKLPVELIAYLFKDGWDPKRSFDEEKSKNVVLSETPDAPTLFDIIRRTRARVEKSVKNIPKAVAEMEQEGVRTETNELGKVVLTIVVKGESHRMPIGFTATKALGYDTYISWDDEHNSFFMSSTRNLEEVYKKVKQAIPVAKLIRGVMILVPPIEENKDFDLASLLGSLGLVDVDPDKLKSKSKEGGVEVPLMITRDLEQQLHDLGYKKKDVNGMTPEEAMEIARAGKTKPPTADMVVEEEEKEKSWQERIVGVFDSLGGAWSKLSTKFRGKEGGVEKGNFLKIFQEAAEKVQKRFEGVKQPSLEALATAFIEEFPEKYFPGLAEIKKEPERLQKMTKDLTDAFREEDKDKRNKKIDEWFNTYYPEGIVRGGLKKLTKKYAEWELMWGQYRKEPTPEEKEKSKKELEAMKKEAMGFKEWMVAGGFIGGAILLAGLIAFIICVAIMEKMMNIKPPGKR